MKGRYLAAFQIRAWVCHQQEESAMSVLPSIRINAPLRSLIWLLLPCSLVAAGTASAATCRVSPTGSGNGSSWGQAANLQSALNNSACTEVWVKQGTYKPGSARSDAFRVNPGVKVYGGFAGNEAARSQRNPASRATILSGDIGAPNNNGDNSYHVVVMDGTTGTKIDGTTVLDGFTVTQGNADGDVDLYQAFGGGLFCNAEGVGSQCSPTLSQLTFNENQAGWGGAMFNNGLGGVSSPTLSSIVFNDNTAVNYGGGMYCDGSLSGKCSPTLSNVSFTTNTAGTSGGAMMNDGAQGLSNPSLNNVTFSGNTATAYHGGAMYNNGYKGNSSPVLSRVIFDGNQAGSFGGAMYNEGNEGLSSPVMTDVAFSNNYSALAGAMHNNGNAGISSPVMNRVTFSGNKVSASAGAIYNDGRSNGEASPIISNATFVNNSNPNEFGGAIYSYAGNGGTASARLSNVTFTGNGAKLGGALYNDGRSGGNVNPVLRNVILWGDVAASSVNGPEIYNDAGAGVNIASSVVQGGCASIIGATCGAGNRAGDPKLGALADNGGFTPTMMPGVGSSAIDTGNATTCANAPVNNLDQRGAARPHGSACDIGSVEAGADADSIFANGFE